MCITDVETNMHSKCVRHFTKSSNLFLIWEMLPFCRLSVLFHVCSGGCEWAPLGRFLRYSWSKLLVSMCLNETKKRPIPAYRSISRPARPKVSGAHDYSTHIADTWQRGDNRYSIGKLTPPRVISISCQFVCITRTYIHVVQSTECCELGMFELWAIHMHISFWNLCIIWDLLFVIN